MFYVSVASSILFFENEKNSAAMPEIEWFPHIKIQPINFTLQVCWCSLIEMLEDDKNTCEECIQNIFCT